MIVEFVLNAGLALAGAALSVLPQSDPLDLADGASAAIGLVRMFDGGLPIHETLALAGVFLLAYSAVVGFAVIRQLWRFVPVVGGG